MWKHDSGIVSLRFIQIKAECLVLFQNFPIWIGELTNLKVIMAAAIVPENSVIQLQKSKERVQKDVFFSPSTLVLANRLKQLLDENTSLPPLECASTTPSFVLDFHG